MKVYILKDCINYVGDVIVTVYSSRDAADKARADLAQQPHADDQYYSVEEWDVQ